MSELIRLSREIMFIFSKFNNTIISGLVQNISCKGVLTDCDFYYFSRDEKLETFHIKFL